MEPGEIYHAWNMIWLENTGWITVGTRPIYSWQRIDTTFAAGQVPMLPATAQATQTAIHIKEAIMAQELQSMAVSAFCEIYYAARRGHRPQEAQPP
ncbi:MAG: hypothetical protein ACLUFT_11700 [Gemmiger formicilis]|uniref:hypothetical protein n=1 Tax=Gemmiger formicilis TaxID=745368 RepID=UPI003991B671